MRITENQTDNEMKPWLERTVLATGVDCISEGPVVPEARPIYTFFTTTPTGVGEVFTAVHSMFENHGVRKPGCHGTPNCTLPT